jgi:uncharacterized phage infection (PIP) family protein YhgE
VPDPEEIDQRLTTLEEDVRRLRDDSRSATVARADAAAARTLAAGAYEEVGDVRTRLDAHTRTLNALRADQLDLKAHVDEGFAKVNTGIAQITTLLRTLTGETREQGD